VCGLAAATARTAAVGRGEGAGRPGAPLVEGAEDVEPLVEVAVAMVTVGAVAMVTPEGLVAEGGGVFS